MTILSRRCGVTREGMNHFPWHMMRLFQELERDTRELEPDWKTFDLNTSSELDGDVFLIRMSVEVDT